MQKYLCWFGHVTRCRTREVLVHVAVDRNGVVISIRWLYLIRMCTASDGEIRTDSNSLAFCCVFGRLIFVTPWAHWLAVQFINVRFFTFNCPIDSLNCLLVSNWLIIWWASFIRCQVVHTDTYVCQLFNFHVNRNINLKMKIMYGPNECGLWRCNMLRTAMHGLLLLMMPWVHWLPSFERANTGRIIELLSSWEKKTMNEN